MGIQTWEYPVVSHPIQTDVSGELFLILTSQPLWHNSVLRTDVSVNCGQCEKWILPQLGTRTFMAMAVKTLSWVVLQMVKSRIQTAGGKTEETSEPGSKKNSFWQARTLLWNYVRKLARELGHGLRHSTQTRMLLECPLLPGEPPVLVLKYVSQGRPGGSVS